MIERVFVLRGPRPSGSHDTVRRAWCSSVLALGAFVVAPSVARAQPAQHSQPAHQPREARVSVLSGSAELLGAQRREIAVGDALTEGQHVRLGEGASATFAAHGGATLALRDRAELFLYGDPSAPTPAGQPPQRDTIARRGTTLVSTSAAPFVLATASCAVTVLPNSEVLVRADARRTRIVVRRGRARVRAMGRDAVFRENQGGKIELNQRALPRPLVGAPQLRPQVAPAYTFGGTVQVPIQWALPRGTSAARWRVQLSREQDFSTLIHDRTVSGTSTEEVVTLPAGRYFARVVGIDADELDGRSSAVQAVEVAGPRVVPGREGRVARVEVPAGMRCGLDTSPPALQPGAMELTPGRNHTLRCLRAEGSTELFEMAITAAESGPLQHQVRVTSDVQTDQRTLALRLMDARGYGVPYATVRVEAPQGATVERVVEGSERGTYNATVRWPARVGRGRLRFVINEAVTFEELIEP
ncbi:MAG: hypothetical protein JNK05_32545 [Myxococcales bacterium]|nr:hypothetical protein [Myxococcales bacterium]